MLKRAKYSFSQKFCASECVIKNLSETGALLEFPDGMLVPDRFKLHNELDGYDIDCEIVRRVGNAAGVRFVGERTPAKRIRHQVITLPNRRPISDHRAVQAVAARPACAEESSRIVSPTFARQKVVFGKR